MRELSPPPSARSDPNATEMLRLWAAHRKLDVSINIGVYADQGFDEADAWGIIMSDFARHVSRALAQRYDKDEEVELTKIKQALLRELDHPTSPITGT